ncbi:MULTISPECIES: hypothetical protein [unclassified Mycobacteroides]|uniref:hypothetical protein n=1 Tax=unclassified Mycobacteroides TaxID=2618759 RepID=UPI00071622E2|nr:MULTISPECIES: hypothetical protein [unclassified Mycobacteroides]KRQ27140.1 hypothetical protein AOT87_04140 [Mycobacteroides sp. H003]KRQ32550.1 hypothetical protein AOT91_11720 [Mycobacteroides sp. H092]KRQ42105.1 hypothetical protein AOT88_25385 [Mycobacteroides sp. H063]KRQ48028.1 hypothetical protein AOT92_00250 [Mycobacteroides sp. H101]KRQ52911.1 hypothetical protein AOT94_26545 [Mycobacteroides sp. HXVII]
MSARKFRKRPVIVEAMRWDGTATGSAMIVDWIYDNDAECQYYAPGEWNEEWPTVAYIKIETLEGSMLASSGDWIIRGVAGEFYPCKPDIFEKTYEPVEESGK